MNRRRFSLTVLATCCVLLMGNRPSIYPPELAKQIWTDISAFDEPNFYQPGALTGFRSRYRLAISGISCRSYVIRIDERLSGKIRGTVQSRNRCKTDNPDEQFHQFSVNRSSMDELLLAFETAKLWEFYPEFWNSKDPQDICLDGEELIFERLNLVGYGFSTANAQCTASPLLLDAARKMILLSSEKNALRLLN